MAYEIEFRTKIIPLDPEIYINECCWGGDVIRDRLIPRVKQQFPDCFTEQEDWGWFIWIRRDPILLAVDIYCDDPTKGEFRIHVSARKKKWFSFSAPADVPEVNQLKDIVTQELRQWSEIVALRMCSPDFKEVLEN
jgi:hypothetical protein